ncbi:venom allergen 5 [Cryptotermes secundus]|uniref:venom allergen 5 n=1 Tax=Cryptotermes secundus TaxID=105785 RepID=UPI000CD7CB2F|nr:venom allergen 5 [Cryptotermes secundus]
MSRMAHYSRGHQLTLLLLCGSLATSLAYYQQSCAGKTLLRSGGLSCTDRQAILEAHNKARQTVALGRVPGQPAASRMLEMVWDEELAAVAQRWADKCTLAHDGARDVSRFPVGQNIAVTWTTRTNAGAAPDFRRQIMGWFNEVRQYGFYSPFRKGTGHYSQLVWGDTYLVGCGYSHYYDPSRGYTKLYVCNYGPGGNVIGAQPYLAGNPSCSTQEVTPSRRYQGLCELNGHAALGASCTFNSPYGNYGSTAFSSQSYTTRPYATPPPFTRPTYAPTRQTYTTTRHQFSSTGFRHYYG